MLRQLFAIITALISFTGCELIESLGSSCSCDDPRGHEGSLDCQGDNEVIECVATAYESGTETEYSCHWEHDTYCDHGCADGECMACQPDCDGRQCGDDGCEGSCGQCEGDLVCDEMSGLCGDVTCESTRQLACGDRIDLNFAGADATNDIIFNGCLWDIDFFNGTGPEMVFSFEDSEAYSVSIETHSSDYLINLLTPGLSGACALSECIDSAFYDIHSPVPSDGRLFVVLETEAPPSETLDLEVRCGARHCVPDLGLECGDQLENINIETFPVANDILAHGCTRDWTYATTGNTVVFSFESTDDQRLSLGLTNGFAIFLIDADESGNCDVDLCTEPNYGFDVSAGQSYFFLVQRWSAEEPIFDVSLECCVRDCDALECGDDGCGGLCGTCADDAFCQNGICVSP